MRIALDWDQTWTRDPEFWARFVRDAKARKHDIRIVTMRGSDQIGDILYEQQELDAVIPVITTNMVQKRPHCEAIGWMPDIWIDDSPEFIVRHDNDAYLNVFKA